MPGIIREQMDFWPGKHSRGARQNPIELPDPQSKHCYSLPPILRRKKALLIRIITAFLRIITSGSGKEGNRSPYRAYLGGAPKRISSPM